MRFIPFGLQKNRSPIGYSCIQLHRLKYEAFILHILFLVRPRVELVILAARRSAHPSGSSNKLLHLSYICMVIGGILFH